MPFPIECSVSMYIGGRKIKMTKVTGSISFCLFCLILTGPAILAKIVSAVPRQLKLLVLENIKENEKHDTQEVKLWK